MAPSNRQFARSQHETPINAPAGEHVQHGAAPMRADDKQNRQQHRNTVNVSGQQAAPSSTELRHIAGHHASDNRGTRGRTPRRPEKRARLPTSRRTFADLYRCESGPPRHHRVSDLFGARIRFFGESDSAIQILQMFVDSSAAVLVFLVAVEFFPLGAAVVAGMMAAISPQFSWNSVLLAAGHVDSISGAAGDFAYRPRRIGAAPVLHMFAPAR